MNSLPSWNPHVVKVASPEIYRQEHESSYQRAVGLNSVQFLSCPCDLKKSAKKKSIREE